MEAYEFQAADFKDPFALVRKLRSGRSALSKVVWGFFAEDAKDIVNRGWEPPPSPQGVPWRLSRAEWRVEVQEALADELTRLVYRGPLYTPERFGRVTLSKKARRLLKAQPTFPELGFLNAVLLHDAYPHEIGPVRWRVTSGAKAAAVLEKQWTRAARASQAVGNRVSLQARRKDAERQLKALGKDEDAWRAIRVGSPGAFFRYHQDKARQKLGGDRRDAARKRKAGTPDISLELACLAAEIAALADHALKPEVQQDPVELHTTMRRLGTRIQASSRSRGDRVRLLEEWRKKYEPDIERGRKNLAALRKAAEARARSYREREPKMLQAAREYKSARPKASVREVAGRLSRCGYGQFETLRKNEKLKTLFPHRKKSG